MTNSNWRLASLLLLTASLGGCNFSFHLGGEKLDTAKVESSIKDGLKSQLDMTVSAVTCSKDVKQEKDGKFQCQVTGDGLDSFPVTVMQTDDQGNIRWDTPQGLISFAKLEPLLQQGIEQKAGMKVTADCGVKFKVMRKDETHECQVTNETAEKGTVKVTATDDTGGVDWRLK